jgi:hypothetical protein
MNNRYAEMLCEFLSRYVSAVAKKINSVMLYKCATQALLIKVLQLVTKKINNHFSDC